MINKCDLHIHTAYSDGSMSVKDVIYYAEKAGISCLAVTDHDTLHGVGEAVKLGERAGIRVIPGVEATVMDKKRHRPVHVLCYFPENINLLQSFLNQTLRKRNEQKYQMIEKAHKIYPLLEPERVLEYAKVSDAIFTPHIMQVLCDLGYTNTVIGKLERELFSGGGSCYVPSDYPDIYDLLEVAAQVKTVLAIAHPEQFDSFELAEELSAQKKIRAIEYDHPRNGERSRKKIQAIAQKYHLLMTGGSDFHGQYARHPHPIGSYGCGVEIVEKLIECQNGGWV